MSGTAQHAAITGSTASTWTGRLIAWGLIIAFGIGFFVRHGVHFYLDQSDESFGRWAAYRIPILLHITGGLVALSTAPIQFWIGYRGQPMHVHRWVGRIFVTAVALGSLGAIWLSLTSAMRNLPYAVGLLMLAVAWISTTAMAYVAIRNRMIELHKEWMIRAYVVTLAFVTYRIIADWIPLNSFPRREVVATISWASWVVPLFATDLILQAKRMRETLSSS